MKSSRRVRRMDRANRRAKRQPGFNLVSLMDVFTILVFFLLVNSSTTEDLPNPDVLKLPESVAEQKPEETMVVMVTESEVLVQGTAVADVRDVLASEQRVVGAIRDELRRQKQRSVGPATRSAATRDEVTIMGDRKIPFELLKRIMSSCTAAGYQTISLAVIQRARQDGSSG